MLRRLLLPLGIGLLIAGAGSAQDADTASVGTGSPGDTAAVGTPTTPDKEGAGQATGILADEFFGTSGALEPDRLISVSYTNKTLEEVCRDLSRKLGINFVTARGLEEERITLNLNSVRWRKVIEYLASKYDLEMETWDDNMIVFSRPPQVSMEFADADIRIVLDLLARQVSKNIVLHERVQGNVTLNLQKVPWKKALDTIAKTAGYAVVQEDAEGSLIRIIPRDLLQEEIEIKFIQLRYVRPPSIYRAIMPTQVQGAGEEGGLGTNFFNGAPTARTGDPEQDFTLLQALRGILERQQIAGETIFYDSFSNALLVAATKPKLMEIETLIRTLDKEPLQVFVDVTFISTSNRDFVEHGLRFDDAPGDGEERGIVSRLIMQNTQGTVVSADGAFDTGNDVLDTRSTFLGQFPFSFGETSDRFEREFMIPALLDFTQTAAILRFAEFDENSRITQSPTLLTLSDHEATIFVGEQVPFVQQTGQTDANGNLEVTLAEGDGSPIAVGFTLFITPHVIPESNEIIMSVIPRVNALTGTTSPIGGLERFSDPSGDEFIDLPRTADQIVVTKLLVESGRTAVIGGLMQERLSEQESRIPIISDIPIIGPLFVWKSHTSTLENLLIFITPTIVRGTEQSTQLFEEQHRKLLDSDFFYGKYRALPGDKWMHKLDGSEWGVGDDDEEE